MGKSGLTLQSCFWVQEAIAQVLDCLALTLSLSLSHALSHTPTLTHTHSHTRTHTLVQEAIEYMCKEAPRAVVELEVTPQP